MRTVIKLEHVSKKYEPAYYVYDDDGKLLATLDYALYANMLKETTTEYVTVSGNNYKKENIKLSYNTSEIKYYIYEDNNEVYKTIDKKSITPGFSYLKCFILFCHNRQRFSQPRIPEREPLLSSRFLISHIHLFRTSLRSWRPNSNIPANTI